MENDTHSTLKNLFNVSTDKNSLRIYLPPVASNDHYSKVLWEIGRALCNMDNPSEVVIHVTNTTDETDLLATTLARLGNEINAAEHRLQNNS